MTGRWSVLFLLEMGRPNEQTLARCPTLRVLLERHRTLTSHAGSMYFSCLGPRTRVAEHQGPTNLRVRCHLGLEVPEACGVRVGGIVGGWQEGRCIVFDDSFRHEVWNDSDRRRLVLVLDLWHPDLSDDEVALLSGLHRYGAASGSIPREYWARNDADDNAGKRAQMLRRLAPTSRRSRNRLPTARLQHCAVPLPTGRGTRACTSPWATSCPWPSDGRRRRRAPVRPLLSTQTFPWLTITSHGRVRSRGTRPKR